MYDLVIRGGKIVGPETIYEGLIAIKDGKIAAITTPEVNLDSKEVIEAHGKLLFPGGIDCHAHFNDPGFEWREDFIHGTGSAAAGGITTIIDMPLQNDPAVTTQEIFNRKSELLKGKGVVDYAFWGGLVDNNVDSLQGLHESGAAGLKAFIGPVSPDYSSVHSGIIREAMVKTASYDILLGFHCEDYSIIKYEEEKAIRENRHSIPDYLASRPVCAEVLATENIIRLAKETGAKVHICHISHPEVAQKIKEAQASGIRITGETCTHYLVYSEEDFINNGTLFKCAPPLRTKNDKEMLWNYVIDGTISCVGSDHSPCTLEEKAVDSGDIWKAWGGISGVQSIFQVMFDAAVNQRGLQPQLLTRVLASGPAKAFNLYPQKGVLLLGSDADIVILDPNRDWEITNDSLFYKNKISAFVGLKGKGLVEQTIVRGHTVFRNGKITAEPGIGKLIKSRRGK